MIIRPRWTLVALASVSASALTWLAAGGHPMAPPAIQLTHLQANQAPATISSTPASPARGAEKGALAPAMAAVAMEAPVAPAAPSARAASGTLSKPADDPAASAVQPAAAVTPAFLAPETNQALTPKPISMPQDQDELQDPDFLDEEVEETETDLTTTLQEEQAAAPKAVQSSKKQAATPAADELTSLTRRLQENPEDTVALNNLAVLYAGKADMQGFAESLFGLLESLRPADPTIAANLAAHRLHLARKDKTLQFGRKGQLLTVSAVTTVARAGSPW